MDSSLEQIKREFLVEGVDDYIGLWQIPSRVRFHLNVQEFGEVKEASIELMRQLVVRERLLVAGELAEEGGFKPWSLAPEEVIEYIEQLWSELGRDPNLGDDIPWFDLTARGEKAARISQQVR